MCWYYCLKNLRRYSLFRCQFRKYLRRASKSKQKNVYLVSQWWCEQIIMQTFLHISQHSHLNIDRISGSLNKYVRPSTGSRNSNNMNHMQNDKNQMQNSMAGIVRRPNLSRFFFHLLSVSLLLKHFHMNIPKWQITWIKWWSTFAWELTVNKAK